MSVVHSKHNTPQPAPVFYLERCLKFLLQNPPHLHTSHTPPCHTPPVPPGHVAEHSLKLWAVTWLTATAQQLGEWVHGVVAVGAQGGHKASVGGVFTARWSRAHCLHPHLLTGVCNYSFCQVCSSRHRHFIVAVSRGSIEQYLTCEI